MKNISMNCVLLMHCSPSSIIEIQQVPVSSLRKDRRYINLVLNFTLANYNASVYLSKHTGKRSGVIMQEMVRVSRCA